MHIRESIKRSVEKCWVTRTGWVRVQESELHVSWQLSAANTAGGFTFYIWVCFVSSFALCTLDEWPPVSFSFHVQFKRWSETHQGWLHNYPMPSTQKDSCRANNPRPWPAMLCIHYAHLFVCQTTYYSLCVLYFFPPNHGYRTRERAARGLDKREIMSLNQMECHSWLSPLVSLILNRDWPWQLNRRAHRWRLREENKATKEQRFTERVQ